MQNTHGITIRDGAWLDKQTFPPVQWVVPDIIAEGLTVLAGGPKVGKSWLVLSLALGIASGGRVLGQVELGKTRPVLYMALEDGDRRLQARARKLLGGQPIPGKFQYVTTGKPGQLLYTLQEWLQSNAEESPVAIVDTFAKIRPAETAGENSYERDYRHAGLLKSYVDPIPGAGLVLVHHTRKDKGDGGDFIEAVSGTQGISGAADQTIVLRRNRTDDDGLLQVTGRDVLEAEYAVTHDGGTWILAGGTTTSAASRAREGKATRNLGDDAARVVRYVIDNGPVSPGDVASALDIQGTTVRSYLTRAVEARRITRIERGKYGPVACATSATATDRNAADVADATVLQFERRDK